LRCWKAARWLLLRVQAGNQESAPWQLPDPCDQLAGLTALRHLAVRGCGRKLLNPPQQVPSTRVSFPNLGHQRPPWFTHHGGFFIWHFCLFGTFGLHVWPR